MPLSVSVSSRSAMTCVLGVALAIGVAASATADGPADARVGQRPSSPGPAPAQHQPQPQPGTVTGRQPLVPASQVAPRGQRSFKRCNDEALKRRYRGAERRHFVARCRLGYGMRLFRRRGAPPA